MNKINLLCYFWPHITVITFFRIPPAYRGQSGY